MRPPLAGVLLLASIAAVPWADQQPHRAGNGIASEARGSRDSIVLTPWDGVHFEPQHFDLLVPPYHPDAQDWPRGMVIGRAVASVDPGIQLWLGSPLANVMSAFLAPWLALAHQLGA